MMLRRQVLVASSLLSSCLAFAADVPKWINPGGMWMPEQIKQQKGLLGKLGVQDPAFFSDPQRMSSVVSLGFCSASFVSKKGLVITNHHCARDAVNHMTKEALARGDASADYVKTGFYAKKLEEEAPAGSGYHVYVTQSEEDVTARVTAGLELIVDHTARGFAQENRIKAIEQDAEKADSDIKAEVKAYFRGEKFILIKKLNIKDVRVVYVPENRIGNFGGETDNWHWQRQVGDYSFLRAYVSPDGKSREYHKDNVPYAPKSFLQIEPLGIKEGDLALVAGYPGRTVRLHTAGEIKWRVEEFIPFTQKKYGSLRTLLGELSGKKEDWRKKLDGRIKSLDNSMNNYKESMAALKRINYVAKKKEQQDAMSVWGKGAPRYTEAIEEMEIATAKLRQNWKKDDVFTNFSVNFISSLIHVFRSATHIARMAEERSKPDAERHPDYQERKWKEMIQEEEEAQLGYDSEISKQILHWVLKQAIDNAAAPDFVQEDILPELVKGDGVDIYIRSQIDKLYVATSLEKKETRVQLLKEATVESLHASTDPIIQIGLKLAAIQKIQDNKDRHDNGVLFKVVPRYIDTLRAFLEAQGKLLAPDANSTLRVTFGHVAGYRSQTKEGEWQYPFTDLDSLVQKHRIGDKEFEVPERILGSVQCRKFAPFGAGPCGNVHVNFLAALDTTGGNSGSAALNSSGKLIGLLFDGNSDALYSDYEFNGKEVRSILVDIRYVLWLMTYIDNTTRLLEEVGLAGWKQDHAE